MVKKLLPDPSLEEASKKRKPKVDMNCMAADTGYVDLCYDGFYHLVFSTV